MENSHCCQTSPFALSLSKGERGFFHSLSRWMGLVRDFLEGTRHLVHRLLERSAVLGLKGRLTARARNFRLQLADNLTRSPGEEPHPVA